MSMDGIEELWRMAERAGRPVVALRVPGPGVDRVREAFGGLVPPEVAEWFSWCDGVAHQDGQVQDDAALVPGYEPLSIVDAEAIKKWFGNDDPALGRHWIPLLGTGGGDFYAATFGEDLKRTRVVSVMIGGDSRIAFPSVDEMVRGFSHLYESGVFFVNEDGVLDADDDQWIEFEKQAARNY